MRNVLNRYFDKLGNEYYYELACNPKTGSYTFTGNRGKVLPGQSLKIKLGDNSNDFRRSNNPCEKGISTS